MNRTIQPIIQELTNFNIQQPVRTTLPNGVPLTVIDAGDQEVVRIDILFSGGRWHQAQKLQALFTNRMLREGTRKYSAAAIAEKLDYYGSWLELSSSAEHAYITMYSLNKYVSETLDIVESMIKEPIFPEKELHTVLEMNIQQYLVNISKVDFLAQRAMSQALYGEQHPCGSIADEADYRAISGDVLRTFYTEHYHSLNCSVFLSGRVTENVLQKVTDVFGTSFGNNQQKTLAKNYTFSSVSDKRIFVEREDALQSAVRLGNTTIVRQHPDYLKMRVLITLFGGYFGSRLMSNIREDKGYTYGISAGVLSYPESGSLIISTEADNEYVEPLINEIYHEIDKLHHDLVPKEELSMVRNYMLGEMCRNYESAFSLSDAWIFIYTNGLDDAYFARSLQALNEITPEEIRLLSQQYLCKETLKEVIAGKKMS